MIGMKGVIVKPLVDVRMQLIQTPGMEFEVATCGNGDKFALCLHGFPENAHSWRFQIRFLASLGYTVWAPNLRGYGRTSRPLSVMSYRLRRLLDDVSRLIDASGFESTLLLGHDWGGSLTWYYAALRRRRLSGAVLFNSPHPVRIWQSLFNPQQLVNFQYMGLTTIPGAAETLFADGGPYSCLKHPGIRMTPEVRSAYMRNLREPGSLVAMTNWYRANLDPRSIEPVIAQSIRRTIETPVLFFWGAQDRTYVPEIALGTQQFVEHYQFRYFRELHHWPHQEAPGIVNDEIGEWLHWLESPSSSEVA